MGRTFRKLQISPALVVAVVALVAAFGGGAVAGVAVEGLNSKEKKQVRQISLKQAKRLVAQIPAGPRGKQGPTGAEGPRGPQGEGTEHLWAVVDPLGNLVRSSAGVTSTQLFAAVIGGSYEVDFGRNVTNCALLATLGRTDAADLDPDPGTIGTAYRNGNPQAVYVKTGTTAGTPADRSFHLGVIC
jgi:hypothetical protein